MTSFPEVIVDGPSGGPRFLFAHGAGAPMDSPFMNDVATGLAARGVEVVRFEFPYMAGRRVGKKRPPDREPILLATWRAIITNRRHTERLFIGGKSMGGRMASMVAGEVSAAGVICFGYPFHAPGKEPTPKRLEHLATLTTPALIIQGTRDALGSRDEVASYTLSPSITIEWIEGGDHSFRSKAHVQQAIEAAARFVRGSGKSQVASSK